MIKSIKNVFTLICIQKNYALLSETILLLLTLNIRFHTAFLFYLSYSSNRLFFSSQISYLYCVFAENLRFIFSRKNSSTTQNILFLFSSIIHKIQKKRKFLSRRILSKGMENSSLHLCTSQSGESATFFA